MRKIAYQ